MGCLVKCVWPLITLAVLAGSVLVYVFYPPVCSEPERTSHESSSGPSPTQTSVEFPWEVNYRLPDTIVPLSYSLLVHPDLTTGLFSGSARVMIEVTQPAEYLLLNIDGISVGDTKLSTQGGSSVRLRRAFEYRPNQFWVVVTEESLRPGLYRLDLSYSGSMLGDIVGLYMSGYTDDASQIRY